jgi:hypothetical protein
VLITAAGRRRLAEIEQVTSRLEQRILGLSAKELATLHKLLNKAMANASAGGGGDDAAAKADVLVSK